MIDIPILNSRAQELVITLGGVSYRLQFQYNERAEIWTMNILQEVGKVVLIQGLPLVLGQNLLEPYNFNMGSMVVYDNSDKGKEARFNGFATENSLLWLSDAELVA